MKLTAVLEQRYDRTPDGQVWTPGAHDYAFWKRYLSVFGQVQVVARVREVPFVGAAMRPAGGEGVAFTAVPHYIGPEQYFRVQRQVRRVIAGAVRGPQAGAVVLRVPGALSNVAFQFLKDQPFAAEVVADPYDLYAPGLSDHPLRPVFRALNTRQMKAQCRRAGVVAYVTREALQRRYPTSGSAFGLSDVDLPPEAYAERGRRWQPGPHQAVMVCTLQSNYKGVGEALTAVKLLRERGLNMKLRIVGEGALRPRFEAQAAALGIADLVAFVGAVPAGADVRRQLDSSDLFFMPSLQEGLPRAMVEAMARGLPVLGSDIGGIPELIGASERFAARDAGAAADALQRLLTDEARYNALGERNLEVARSYANETLGDLRLRFYRAVRDQVAQHGAQR